MDTIHSNPVRNGFAIASNLIIKSHFFLVLVTDFPIIFELIADWLEIN